MDKVPISNLNRYARWRLLSVKWCILRALYLPYIFMLLNEGIYPRNVLETGLQKQCYTLGNLRFTQQLLHPDCFIHLTN